MKQRILEILDEYKRINNNIIDTLKNNIINNKSLLNFNNEENIEKNNIKLQSLQKEFELLVREYEKEIMIDNFKNERMFDSFKQKIKEIVESIKEEDGEIS